MRPPKAMIVTPEAPVKAVKRAQLTSVTTAMPPGSQPKMDWARLKSLFGAWLSAKTYPANVNKGMARLVRDDVHSFHFKSNPSSYLYDFTTNPPDADDQQVSSLALKAGQIFTIECWELSNLFWQLSQKGHSEHDCVLRHCPRRVLLKIAQRNPLLDL